MGKKPRLPDFVRLFFRLLGDRRVGWGAKALFLGAVLYVLSPLDLLPDFMPIVGELDDLTLFALACRMFISLCPYHVLCEHVARLDPTGTWQPFNTALPAEGSVSAAPER